jgi:hypothetical protein
MSEDKKLDTKVEERAPQVHQPILSGNDAFIGSIVQRQPSKVSMQAVSRDYVDITELPAGCDEYKKKYAFRWIGKSERQVSKATEVEGWVICTRQNAPFIPSSYFKIHGAVEKNGLLLAFMLTEQAAEKRERNRMKHEHRKKALRNMSKKPNYYEAKLTKDGAEERDAHLQGRDF